MADRNNQIDTGFVKTMLNCFDESMLEMMLRLSDTSEGLGVNLQLDAATVGGSICTNYLKTLYALGFERAVRIECEEQLTFWPELTAGLITEYVSRAGGQDIIIMGIKSADGENGKVPLLTAEQLGWKCITQVIGAELIDDQHIRVSRRVDGGVCIQRVTLPCVLAVGDAPYANLRVPTLKERMKKGKKEIEVYTMEDLHVAPDFDDIGTSAELIGLEAVNKTRTGAVIAGDTVQAQAAELYQQYLKGRLKNL